MNRPLLRLSGIDKQFPLSGRRTSGLVGLMGALFNRPLVHGSGVCALYGVDLTVNRGEAVGIVGENGAGKSTLLKIIAGVLTPTSGEVEVSGRVAALLELGAGFHPEFTGRQNLVAAAGLAGMGATEIEMMMPEVLEFSELHAHIDRPLKHYSSGMVVRLGFALITAMRPDILISDEVLAVGDESFQKKCIRWLEDYLSGGGTLLLVSHSVYHLQKLCHRALWLRQGKICQSGDVFSVSQSYLAYHEAKLRGDRSVPGTPDPRIQLIVNGETGGRSPETRQGQDVEIVVMPLTTSGSGSDLHRVSIRLTRTDGAVLGQTELFAENGFYARWKEFPLLPGQYRIEAEPIDASGNRCGAPERILLRVRGQAREFGSVRLSHRWVH